VVTIFSGRGLRVTPRVSLGREPVIFHLSYDSRALLFRLVDELAEDQLRVLVMRFAEEKSIREIAEALGRSEGAVKQLQFRALENLRKGIHHRGHREHGDWTKAGNAVVDEL